MKVLYLVPHVPNPTKARSYFQVRGLLEAGHSLTVATLERGEGDARYVWALREMGASVLSARLSKSDLARNALPVVLSNRPLQTALFWSKDLLWQIENELAANPPDVIHVEHLRMTPYGLRLHDQWPVVWDSVDYLAPLFKEAAKTGKGLGLRLGSMVEAPRLAHYEKWLTGQFPATLVISRRDQAFFQEGNPFAERVYVTHPGLPLMAISGRQPRADNLLIMTGNYNYHPNIASALYFAGEILPLVLKEKPDTRLQLVGANPAASILALQSASIEVTGFVESLTDSLTHATIAVAPVLYAAGMQNKVIEAFQTATPLVASSVALRGLDVRHDEQALIADTPADFAAAVLRLLGDPALRARLGAAGRTYVEQNHDLQVTTAQLVDIYQQVIARRNSPRSK